MVAQLANGTVIFLMRSDIHTTGMKTIKCGSKRGEKQFLTWVYSKYMVDQLHQPDKLYFQYHWAPWSNVFNRIFQDTWLGVSLFDKTWANLNQKHATEHKISKWGSRRLECNSVAQPFFYHREHLAVFSKTSANNSSSPPFCKSCSVSLMLFHNMTK